MEETSLLISFKDSQCLWSEISPYIEPSLPLSGVRIRYSNSNPVVLPDLDVKFVLEQQLTSGNSSQVISQGISHELHSIRRSLSGVSTVSNATTHHKNEKLIIEKSQALPSLLNLDGIRATTADGMTGRVISSENDPVSKPDLASIGSSRQDIGLGTDTAIGQFRSLVHRPFLYILFFQADSVDVFRSQQRKFIRSWIETHSKRQSEWLLILVNYVTEGAAQDKIQRKFFEKLRPEVLTQNELRAGRVKERFFRVCIADTTSASSSNKETTTILRESWASFFPRLREAIGFAIEARYNALEEELTRQEVSTPATPTLSHTPSPSIGSMTSNASPRGQFVNSPGRLSSPTPVVERPRARYSSVFFATEELALLHFKCKRFADALLVYQDIDLARSPAVFPKRFRALFKSIGFSSLMDDVPILFDVSRKNYRQMIFFNRISYFDFRCYFFARQQYLRIQLEAGVDFAKQCQQFLRVTTAELREFWLSKVVPDDEVLDSQSFLPKYLIWSFLAAINCANYCMARFCTIKWDANITRKFDPLIRQQSFNPLTRRCSDSAIVCINPSSIDEEENQLISGAQSFNLGIKNMDKMGTNRQLVDTKSVSDSDGGFNKMCTSFDLSSPTTCLSHSQLLIRDICLNLYIFGIQQLRCGILYREYNKWVAIENKRHEVIEMANFIPNKDSLSFHFVELNDIWDIFATRDSAYATDERLTDFIHTQMILSERFRLSALFSLSKAQYTVLHCHQYRQHRKDNPPIFKKTIERPVNQSIQFSPTALRIQSEQTREHLCRTMSLVHEEHWRQLYVITRALLCEIERALGFKDEEMLSSYFLSNRRVDKWIFPGNKKLKTVSGFSSTRDINKKQVDSLTNQQTTLGIQKELFQFGKIQNIPLITDAHVINFSSVMNLDLVSSQTLMIIFDRGALPSKIYFKRFRHLAASTHVSSNLKISDLETSYCPSMEALHSMNCSLTNLSSQSIGETRSDGQLIQPPSQDDTDPNSVTTGVPRVQILASPNMYIFLDIEPISRLSVDLHDEDILNKDEINKDRNKLINDTSMISLSSPQQLFITDYDTEYISAILTKSSATIAPYEPFPVVPELHAFSEIRCCLSTLQCLMHPFGINKDNIPSRVQYNSILRDTTMTAGLSFTAMQCIDHVEQPPTELKTYVSKQSKTGIALKQTSRQTNTIINRYGPQSGITTVGTLPYMKSHRWGVRLKKLNPRQVGYNVKRQLTRQRHSSQPDDNHSINISQTTLSTTNPGKYIKHFHTTDHPSHNKLMEPFIFTNKKLIQQSSHMIIKNESNLEDSLGQSTKHISLHTAVLPDNTIPSGIEASTDHISKPKRIDSIINQLDEEALLSASESFLKDFPNGTDKVYSKHPSHDHLVSSSRLRKMMLSQLNDCIDIHLYIDNLLPRELPLTSIVIKCRVLSSMNSNITASLMNTYNLVQCMNNGQEFNQSVCITTDCPDICYVYSSETDIKEDATISNNPLLFFHIKGIDQSILLKPGFSIITLRTLSSIIGTFMFEEVFLICQRCILSQSIGILPEFDSMRKIYANIRLAKLLLKKSKEKKDHETIDDVFSSMLSPTGSQTRSDVSDISYPNQSIVTQGYVHKNRFQNLPKHILDLDCVLDRQNYLFGARNFTCIAFPKSGDEPNPSFPGGIIDFFMALPVIHNQYPIPSKWFKTEIETMTTCLHLHHTFIMSFLNFVIIKVINLRSSALKKHVQLSLRLGTTELNQQSSIPSGGLAVCWQAATVFQLDHINVNLTDICIDIEPEHSMNIDTYINSDCIPDRQEDSSILKQCVHWVDLPSFSFECQLIIPVIVYPSSKQHITCWKINCPCESFMSPKTTINSKDDSVYVQKDTSRALLQQANPLDYRLSYNYKTSIMYTPDMFIKNTLPPVSECRGVNSHQYKHKHRHDDFNQSKHKHRHDDFNQSKRSLDPLQLGTFSNKLMKCRDSSLLSDREQHRLPRDVYVFDDEQSFSTQIETTIDPLYNGITTEKTPDVYEFSKDYCHRPHTINKDDQFKKENTTRVNDSNTLYQTVHTDVIQLEILLRFKLLLTERDDSHVKQDDISHTVFDNGKSQMNDEVLLNQPCCMESMNSSIKDIKGSLVLQSISKHSNELRTGPSHLPSGTIKNNGHQFQHLQQRFRIQDMGIRDTEIILPTLNLTLYPEAYTNHTINESIQQTHVLINMNKKKMISESEWFLCHYPCLLHIKYFLSLFSHAYNTNLGLSTIYRIGFQFHPIIHHVYQQPFYPMTCPTVHHLLVKHMQYTTQSQTDTHKTTLECIGYSNVSSTNTNYSSVLQLNTPCYPGQVFSLLFNLKASVCPEFTRHLGDTESMSLHERETNDKVDSLVNTEYKIEAELEIINVMLNEEATIEDTSQLITKDILTMLNTFILKHYNNFNLALNNLHLPFRLCITASQNCLSHLSIIYTIPSQIMEDKKKFKITLELSPCKGVVGSPMQLRIVYMNELNELIQVRHHICIREIEQRFPIHSYSINEPTVTHPRALWTVIGPLSSTLNILQYTTKEISFSIVPQQPGLIELPYIIFYINQMIPAHAEWISSREVMILPSTLSNCLLTESESLSSLLS